MVSTKKDAQYLKPTEPSSNNNHLITEIRVSSLNFLNYRLQARLIM